MIIPRIVALGNKTLLGSYQMALFAIARLETDAVMDVEGIGVIIAKAVIQLILVSSAVNNLHRARIVILVEPLAAMTYCQTAVEFCIVSGTLATQLETIRITTIREISQIFILEAIQTCIDTLYTRMIGKIKTGRTITIGNTIDINGRRAISDALIRIPAIIGIIPGTTTDIDVTRASIALLIGKAIGIATIILIIEVIVGIAIDDHVMTATTQLDTRITATVDLEILKDVVLALFYPDTLIA